MLSPLSWWNDLFVNIPIAYAVGSLFGIISSSLFMPMTIVGYWMTNIAGLVLIHHGAKKMLIQKENSYTRRAFMQDMLLSMLYTLGIVLLLQMGLLKDPFH